MCEYLGEHTVQNLVTRSSFEGLSSQVHKELGMWQNRAYRAPDNIDVTAYQCTVWVTEAELWEMFD
jgi:hypothetical protein